MNIKVKTKELQESLQKALNITKPNKLRPAISNVLLKVDEFNNDIKIKGTDLEQTIQISIQGEVLEPGEVLLNAADVVNYLKLEEKEYVNLKYDGSILKVGKIKFSTLDSEEFPDINIDVDDGIEIKVGFIDNFDLISFASPETNNFETDINCIRITNQSMVCTDKYRLVKLDTNNGLEQDISVPMEAVNVIPKIFNGKLREDIRVHTEPNKLTITKENITYSTRLIQLEYVNFKEIFNNSLNNVNKSITIKKEEFLKTLEKVDIVSRSSINKNAAEFIFSNGKINITATNDNSEISLDLECKYEEEYEEIKVGLNVKFIMQFINKCKGDINIQYSNSEKSFILTDIDNADYSYIMMPIQII